MNKKLSSSFHRINYDKPLSKFNKIMWFLCNFLNNQFKNFNVDKNIKLLQFDLSNYDLNFDKISLQIHHLDICQIYFYIVCLGKK